MLYTECDGHPLIGPNDIVFDAHGGMWFTDHGRRQGRVQHVGAIYYAQPDGSSITEVVFPSESPNGIGLSPDGSRLYAAETHTGRVYAWNVTAPGEVERNAAGAAGGLLCGLPGMQLFDSLGIDADGNVVVATLVTGALTVISPAGDAARPGADRRPDDDERVLGRPRSAHRVRDVLGHRAASCRCRGRDPACASTSEPTIGQRSGMRPGGRRA